MSMHISAALIMNLKNSEHSEAVALSVCQLSSFDCSMVNSATPQAAQVVLPCSLHLSSPVSRSCCCGTACSAACLDLLLICQHAHCQVVAVNPSLMMPPFNSIPPFPHVHFHPAQLIADPMTSASARHVSTTCPSRPHIQSLTPAHALQPPLLSPTPSLLLLRHQS